MTKATSWRFEHTLLGVALVVPAVAAVQILPDFLGRILLLLGPIVGLWAASRCLREDAPEVRWAWAGLFVPLVLHLLLGVYVNAAPPAPPAGLEHMGCDRAGILPRFVGASLGAVDDLFLPAAIVAVLIAGMAAARPSTRLAGTWAFASGLNLFVAFLAAMLVNGCPEI